MTSFHDQWHHAWLRADDGIYRSRFPVALEAPSSAVLRLVQGLWELKGPEALQILRRPIEVLGPVREFERDFVKVAAKSVREVTAPPPEDAPLFEVGGEEIPGVFQPRSDREPVSAILRDKEGRELLRAESGARWNRTLHAEVLLIQEWYRRSGARLPPGARLEVSHKPCRMCAGLIVHWSTPEDPVRVTYRIPVEGCRSRMTILDRLGREELIQTTV